MYTSLMQAYEQAKRDARLRGVPVSKQDTMRRLAPVYAQYAQDATTQKGIDLKTQALAQDAEQFNATQDLRGRGLDAEREQFNASHGWAQELFNRKMEMENNYRDRARPVNYANLAISGLGTLGTGLYANRQEDELLRRLALMKMKAKG